MAGESDKFLQKYHKALVMAVKDQLEKVKPRIASDWVKDWQGELGGPVEGEEDFRLKFEEFLQKELGFAGTASVTIEGEELRIQVEECAICPANEILRQQGEPTLCPILSTGLLAISRVLGKNAELLGVEKDGRVGYCTIKYRITKKR